MKEERGVGMGVDESVVVSAGVGVVWEKAWARVGDADTGDGYSYGGY